RRIKGIENSRRDLNYTGEFMKIASLAPYKIIPAVKGGEKGIYYFLKYIGRHAAITCLTVTENAGNTEGIEFVDVLGSGSKKLRYADFSLVRKIARICKHRGLRHIIIEHPYYAWLGYCLKKFAGLKLIIHSHNIEAARFKSMGKWWWRMMQWYERFAHRHANFNFFITEEDRSYAVKTYRLNPRQCAVITYGVETEAAPEWSEKENCKVAVCAELNVPVTTRLILFNGTLDYGPNRDGLDRILK